MAQPVTAPQTVAHQQLRLLALVLRLPALVVLILKRYCSETYIQTTIVHDFKKGICHALIISNHRPHTT